MIVTSFISNNGNDESSGFFPQVYICSNNIQARQQVIELASQLNFIPVDLESKQLQIYPCDYLLERASGGSHKPGHVFLPLFLGPNCDSSMC